MVTSQTIVAQEASNGGISHPKVAVSEAAGGLPGYGLLFRLASGSWWDRVQVGVKRPKYPLERTNGRPPPFRA
jgi:hypothetical protein